MAQAQAVEPRCLLDDPDRLLTYDEVGSLAGGVSGRSVRKWVADGTGPRVIAVGRHRRIRVRDYLTWLDGQYIEADQARAQGPRSGARRMRDDPDLEARQLAWVDRQLQNAPH